MDHLAGLVHARACLATENDLFPALGDICDLLESELLTVELKHKLTTNLSSGLGCFGNIDLLVFGGRGCCFAAAHTLARTLRANCGASCSCGCPACHSFEWSQ